MSEFSDYYVVYQRVGEHAMVLVGHKNDTPRALTANQFQEDTNRWFYFLNGFRDEDVSQGIHHQLCNLHMSGRNMMVKTRAVSGTAPYRNRRSAMAKSRYH